ncbi:MAG: tetratricopeptide repeat protein [Armatimonadetes bacterium]|nr:tetratricopeptide repeat protein [Armatimonadota bacterium]
MAALSAAFLPLTPAVAADPELDAAQGILTHAQQVRVVATAGDPTAFEEARTLFLEAAARVEGIASRRPLDEDALAATQLRITCFSSVGMEEKRRETLGALLDALPGNVASATAFAGLNRVADEWLGDSIYEVPLLVRTPQYVMRLAPRGSATDAPNAARALQRFADAFPESREAPQALLRALEIWLYDAKEVDAVAELRLRLTDEYPQASEKLRADYLFGLAAFHLGDRGQAVAALEQVGKAAPNSPDGQVAGMLVRAANGGAHADEPLVAAYAYDLDSRSAMTFILGGLFDLTRGAGPAAR